MHESEIIEIQPDETFHFDCNDRIRCFNDCCRDLNQLLTPYDILRLKNNLGLSSSDFLDQYTQRHTGPQTGLPIVSLEPQSPIHRLCPFLTPSGCSVYVDRPSSCRMYPVIRSVARSGPTGETIIRYMLIQEPHCKGFESSRSRNVSEWIDDQELIPYNQNNDDMAALINLKNSIMPGRLSGNAEQLFYTACYDIDRFREQVLVEGRCADLLSNDAPVSAQTDDVDMMKFGLRVLENFLKRTDLNIKSMKRANWILSNSS
jgi:uncharacterized protein